MAILEAHHPLASPFTSESTMLVTYRIELEVTLNSRFLIEILD